MMRFLFLLFLIPACSNGQGFSSSNYKFQLNSEADFIELQGKPLSNYYSNIKTVKLCYSINEDKMYFMNSKKYKFHIEFCNVIFNDNDEIGEFNATNYQQNPNRKYGLATFNFYEDLQLYTLEFVSEDDIPNSLLLKIWKAIIENAKLTKPIFVLLNNSSLLQQQSKLKDIPTILPEKLFAQQNFQPLVIGTAVGYAKKIGSLSAGHLPVSTQDIIFIEGTPLLLPHCKGVVTNTMQTPLSHINVLCHNRKTPACVLVNWDSIITIKKLWNLPIKLTFLENGFIINSANTSEIISQKVAKKIKVNPPNVSVKSLQIFTGKKIISPTIVGSKASGLSTLYKIAKQNMGSFEVPPNAFGIPFFYYRQHILQASISKEIQKLNLITPNKNEEILAQLKVIRKAIKTAPISKALLQMVENQIGKENFAKSYRFRSSSSAEDVEGFNGAGLYESYSGIYADSNKSYDKAIKKVWASVWTEAAFMERQIFGINHAQVCMGVLVHQGFPSEEANGVAITKNMFRDDFNGFTINVQQGEVSVVAPPEDVQCDQLLLLSSDMFTGHGGQIYEQYINRSSINKGKNVLTNAQCEKLFNALDILKNYFYTSKVSNFKIEYDDYALDVEFKFNDGKLFIKQVRPFQ